MRKVYFYPAGRIYSSQWDLINYPPPGYSFVTDATGWDKAMSPIVGSDDAYHLLVSLLGRWLPLHLVKAYLESFLKRIPRDVDLVYSYNHPVLHKTPWVVHVEWATALAGFDIRYLRRHKETVERLLASSWCRKIVTWSEVARKSILHHLDCAGFEDKIELVNLAIQKRDFVKDPCDDRVKLLFVGSINAPRTHYGYNFHVKGGKELLEAFSILSGRYQGLELVMRTSVPPEVKARYGGVPNIRIIDTVIPREQLDYEWRTADIFVLPSHQVTVWGVTLEAMSYELPIITTDVYANSEIVQEGVTGLLISGSDQVPYYVEELVPFGVSSRRKEVDAVVESTTDSKMVEGLVQKASLLIENPELRRRMGKTARHQVEEGRFSIRRRNEKLKRIFDEAIADGAGRNPATQMRDAVEPFAGSRS